MGWSKPVLVHAENKVPDIVPVANITPDGDVRVSWTRYSFEVGNYISAEEIFVREENNKLQFNLEDSVNEIDISLLIESRIRYLT